MITGEVKSKVDRIWDTMWSGGISNPLSVIEQLTYLLFIKRLDELHTLRERKAARTGKPIEDPSHFADATSWGYRLVGRLDYLNAFGGFNVSPRFAWQQDVDGVSPGPGGNFIEGRTALTLGVGFSRQATWQFDLSYTMFSGASRYNLINDRDFIGTNVKYSF